MLSGKQIIEYGIVESAAPEAVQPASVDLTLCSDEFLWPERDTLLLPLETPTYTIHSGCPRLEPGDFVLASTVEDVHIPPEFVGRVEGKSTLARMGLIVHTTAGFIDPGFQGKITLELKNVGPCALVLKPGMYICQLSVQRMERVDSVYNGKYQGATGVEGAKIS